MVCRNGQMWPRTAAHRCLRSSSNNPEGVLPGSGARAAMRLLTSRRLTSAWTATPKFPDNCSRSTTMTDVCALPMRRSQSMCENATRPLRGVLLLSGWRAMSTRSKATSAPLARSVPPRDCPTSSSRFAGKQCRSSRLCAKVAWREMSGISRAASGSLRESQLTSRAARLTGFKRHLLIAPRPPFQGAT